jgi:hypothetical protein
MLPQLSATWTQPAIMRADKIKKRREFIKKVKLAQCEIENCAADDGLHYVKLVSVGEILLTKLLLSDLQLFCATHNIWSSSEKEGRRIATYCHKSSFRQHICFNW